MAIPEREPDDPYRPVLPVLRVLPAPSRFPFPSVEFDRLLAQRIPWWWWTSAAIVLGMLLLGAFVIGDEALIVIVLVLLGAGIVPCAVSVGDDELLVVGDRVYSDETAELPGAVALRPLAMASRRFTIEWQPAPLPTSDGRALSVRVRLDTSIVRAIDPAKTAMTRLSSWQRRHTRLADDLRRYALDPLCQAVNRCGIAESLQADTLAAELAHDLAPSFSRWGLAVVRVEVCALELVDSEARAPDRVWVTRK